MTTNFHAYQSATSKTAVYPEAGHGSVLALSYVGLGLGSEVGEILGKLKKALRDDDGVLTLEARTTILEEAGDVLWYLTRLCAELGVPLAEVASANIVKLEDRKARGVLKGSGDRR